MCYLGESDNLQHIPLLSNLLDFKNMRSKMLRRRAKLLPPHTFGPSPESLETMLMQPEDIPFKQASQMLAYCLLLN